VTATPGQIVSTDGLTGWPISSLVTEEGSYGTTSGGTQRPQPALIVDRCATTQNLTPCP
jgi:hypothetical protein